MVVSLKFNGVRFAVGGIVLSLGPTLLAFDQALKAAAAVIAAAGFVILLSGMFQISFRGAIVRARWSQERILKALSRAPVTACVQILQTWIPEEDFIDKLEHLYLHEDKRFHLRVMLMNCERDGVNDVLAARVKLRSIERSKAAVDIIETRDRLIRLKSDVDARLRQLALANGRSETVDMEIRFYDFMPFGPIYCIDDEVMFVGFYLSHASSLVGPMIEIRRKRSPQLWQIFERSLTNGWDAAVPNYPPAQEKEPARG
jgi:hypothetical protein